MSSGDASQPNGQFPTSSSAAAPSYPGLVHESLERAALRSAVSWVFGQNPVVVIGVLLLTFGGYGLWYSVNVLVPAHLESIQQGYERIQESYVRDREASELAHREQYERLTMHWTQIATEIRAVAKSQELLIRDVILRDRDRRGAGSAGVGTSTGVPGGTE